MSPLWTFLFVLSAPSGVRSQVQLQESGSSLVKPSQTLSLICTVSGFSLNNYGVEWVRQTPGKALEWVGAITSSGRECFNVDLRSRLSITRDTSKSQVSLSLSSVTPADTAVYYCARSYGGGEYGYCGGYVNYPYIDNWGQGILVTVSSASESHPKVFPLVSCVSSPSDENTVALGCLAQDFVPNSVSFSWKFKNNSTVSSEKFLTFPGVLRDGLWSASSQVVLPSPRAPQGSKDHLECSVQHPKDGKTIKTVVVAPRVSASTPTPTPITLAPSTTPRSEGSNKVVNTQSSPGNTFRPQVHLLPPPSEELALNELVTLTCLVRGFNPKDVLVRWLQGNQELPREKYVTWDPLPEPGQSVSTFTVTSVLRVDAEVWKQGDNFSCMVGHEALPLAFTQKTIDRLAGKPTHVNVSVVMSEVDGVCY